MLNHENQNPEKRKLNDENLERFKHEIHNTNWDFLTEETCTDTKFSLFESKYREIYDKNFPKNRKTLKKRKCNKPWILPWLQSACDRKNKLYNIFIKNPSVENKNKYCKMKRFVAKHVRKAKSKYYRQYFNRYSNDSRKQWTMINSLLNRKSKMKNNITKLKFDEKTNFITFL